MSPIDQVTTYQLTEADKEIGPPEYLYSNPVTRAAVNPDSRILAAVLDAGFDPSAYSAPNYGAVFDYDSPLLAAIRAGLRTNVDILLSKGADPNGFPTVPLSQWSARFLRFRPYLPTTSKKTREEVLSTISRSQIEALTAEELDARRKTRARFWAEPEFPLLSTRIDPPMTALEAAVLKGDIPMVDAILRANPDTTAWTHTDTTNTPRLTASFLATSTPLHRAISTHSLPLISHLLSLSFIPSNFPPTTPTCALSPLMSTLTTFPPSLPALTLLLSSPHANPNALTPLFKIHILHLATAALSLPALHLLPPPHTAPRTALGHTLLHVACLPATDEEVNHFSVKIHASVHELRTLSHTYRPLTLYPLKPRGQFRDIAPPFSQPAPTETWERQREVVAWVLANGVAADLSAQDVHGNTPLHYLVSSRAVNEAVVEILRAADGEGEVWTGRKNLWGFTPQNLYEDGKAALQAIEDRGERQETVRYMPHWKDPMGAWVMGRWQSNYPEDG